MILSLFGFTFQKSLCCTGALVHTNISTVRLVFCSLICIFATKYQKKLSSIGFKIDRRV